MGGGAFCFIREAALRLIAFDQPHPVFLRQLIHRQMAEPFLVQSKLGRVETGGGDDVEPLFPGEQVGVRWLEQGRGVHVVEDQQGTWFRRMLLPRAGRGAKLCALLQNRQYPRCGARIVPLFLVGELNIQR